MYRNIPLRSPAPDLGLVGGYAGIDFLTPSVDAPFDIDPLNASLLEDAEGFGRAPPHFAVHQEAMAIHQTADFLDTGAIFNL